MILILGLILLIAAIVVGVAAIATNMGSAHELAEAFKVFGYHMTGSTGMLFLFGVIVGAVAMLGLSLLLGGVRRASRRGRAARHVGPSRRETYSADRDAPIAGSGTTSPGGGSAQGDDSPREHVGSGNGHRHKLHLFGHRAAHR
ncbi:hypothetical protein [Streptomyces sp. NPDC017993]|uniref:hypothetical protein n=1 Tax=Streptomyces sp. NPDC017993 TaxID=3365027 RepID=UPI0037B83F54